MARNTAKGLSIAMESHDDHVFGAISALSGLVHNLPAGREQEVGRLRLNSVNSLFKKAFDEIADEWSEDVMEMIHTRARNDSGTSDRYMSWTRHLYSGGNPANMGDESNALFMFTGHAAGSGNISDGIELELKARLDPARSWSPVSHRTTGIKSGEPYPPWEGRARFMLRRQLGHEEKYLTHGRRTKRELESGVPKYIVSASPSGDRYFYSDRFDMDYTAQKRARDIAFKRYEQVTAQRIMSLMDKSIETALNKGLARLHVEFGGSGDAPAVGRKATKKGIGSIASDVEDIDIIARYGTNLARNFRRLVNK